MRSVFLTIFMTASSRKMATPALIEKMRARRPITEAVWPASTARSGSAAVMKKPKMNTTVSSTHILPCFVIPRPTFFPIGVIARSAPKLKRPMPAAASSVDAEKVR